jgi:hypothetical protein
MIGAATALPDLLLFWAFLAAVGAAVGVGG